MAADKNGKTNLDVIIKKVIGIIDASKNEIFDIAEGARHDQQTVINDLRELKQQVSDTIAECDRLEKDLRESRLKLMNANKNYAKYTQEELQQAYEKADNARVNLAVKREQERALIRRRNDLEIRSREIVRTIEKAEGLTTQVGMALNLMTSDLKDFTGQVENSQQRQLLSLRIIKAQEEERQRVARDIHDGPAQLMSNVVLKTEICEKLMDVDMLRARDELKQLKKIVKDSIQDIRKIIYDLRPMSLDDLGLIPTLQRFALSFQEQSGVIVSFRTRGEFENIPTSVALTIFRVIQEATNNIRKHAQAKNMSISIEVVEKSLKLFITDDGKGFDMEEVRQREASVEGGFGLFSMRERIELIEGSFDMVSSPGKGTRLAVTLPIV